MPVPADSFFISSLRITIPESGRRMALEEFIGQRGVGLSPKSTWIVFKDGSAVTGRFADADRPRNHRLIDLLWEKLRNFLDHLPR